VNECTLRLNVCGIFNKSLTNRNRFFIQLHDWHARIPVSKSTIEYFINYQELHLLSIQNHNMKPFLLLLSTFLLGFSVDAQVYSVNSGDVCQAYVTRYYTFNAAPEATASATLSVDWAYCGGDGFPDNGTLRLWMSTDDLSNYTVANTSNSGNGCSWVNTTYTIPMSQINMARALNGGNIEFYGYINDGCPGGVGCFFADPCFDLTLSFDSSPQASFTAEAPAYCVGSTVIYESTSAGQIDDYDWDFGPDATPATAMGAGPHEVSYSTSGMKPVSLTISNTETSDTVEGDYEIFPLPELSLTADQATCFGQTASILATSSASVTWNEGLADGLSQEVSPETTTLYIATAVDENNCSASAESTVTVNGLPEAIVGEDETICNGSSVVLVASGGTEFNWNEGLGDANELEVSPSETTVYNVVVTDDNGCSDADEVTVTVNQNPALEINEPQEICVGDSSVIQATSDYTVMWNEGLLDGTTHVVSPEMTTLYIATVIDENDCSTSVEALVTVNSNPTIDITESQEICAGESIILEAISDYIPVWNEGLSEGFTQEVSPEITTLYNASVIDENNCFASAEVLVTVNPSPEVSILGIEYSQYCTWDVLSIEGLPAGGVFTGTADLEDLDNITFATDENELEYEITYTFEDENLCSSSVSIFFTVYICFSVEELENQIAVYPNPTSGIVNLDCGELRNQVSNFKLFDAQGKLIDLSISKSSDFVSFDLSAFPDGIYSLSMEVLGTRITKKLILQH